jgi:hypothetical protein
MALNNSTAYTIVCRNEEKECKFIELDYIMEIVTASTIIINLLHIYVLTKKADL